MNESTVDKSEKGFSLMELLVSMTVMMILLAIVSTIFATAMSTRTRQSQRTDALTSARAALQIISRELASSGYGIYNNGIVLADSNSKRIHFRLNKMNSDLLTDDPGEDVTFFFDSATQSIVRYDRFGNPQVSVVVNGISDINFRYFDYPEDNTGPIERAVPTLDTGRVEITVTVLMDPLQGQMNGETVVFKSDVTLRNSNYMLYQY
jgi:type II secretory pathway pseudopilin PulG